MATNPSRDDTVGVIGVGRMGRGLVLSLARGGLRVLYFDPALADESDLKAAGANRAADLAELGPQVDFVVTCLPDLEAIRSTLLGPASVVPHLRNGTVIIDCSTSKPSLTREISESAGRRGIAVVDAPMLRGPKQAAEGKLFLLVGGEEADVRRCVPVFEAISERHVWVGRLGAAHGLKLINNSVTHGNHAVLCEAINLARKLDIDLPLMHLALSNSQASSAKLEDLMAKLQTGDHAGGMAIDVARKDVRLYLEMASELGIPTFVADAVHGVFRLSSAVGYGAHNGSYMPEAFRKIQGLK